VGGQTAIRQPTLTGGPHNGRLSITSGSLDATYGGVPLSLTAAELTLLQFLVSEQDRVVSRTELQGQLWGHVSPTSRVADTYVSRLRTKLRRAGHPGIAVVRNRGYRLAQGADHG
jgi:DNA-binding response OmpR family regulator